MIELRSRSQCLLLEKLCHHSSAFIYRPILILCHTNVKYDNILDKFEFERSRAKVKVATVKILKFGTPQTIVIIVLKIEKFDVTLH